MRDDRPRRETDGMRQRLDDAVEALRPSPAFVDLLRERLFGSEREPIAMISGFHHAVLFCTDTERSRDWFARAGFEYIRGYGGMHWFAAGAHEFMLHPAASGPSGNTPHLHLATDDVDSMFERVRSAGLQPIDHLQPGVVLDGPVTRPWGDREFELEDPDGHRIVFTQS